MKEDIRFPFDVCKCRALARFLGEGVPKALLCSLGEQGEGSSRGYTGGS